MGVGEVGLTVDDLGDLGDLGGLDGERESEWTVRVGGLVNP
jgi:hypothetical protein